jgi:hypothetical protein
MKYSIEFLADFKTICLAICISNGSIFEFIGPTFVRVLVLHEVDHCRHLKYMAAPQWFQVEQS